MSLASVPLSTLTAELKNLSSVETDFEDYSFDLRLNTQCADVRGVGVCGCERRGSVRA